MGELAGAGGGAWGEEGDLIIDDGNIWACRIIIWLSVYLIPLRNLEPGRIKRQRSGQNEERTFAKVLTLRYTVL